MADFDPRNPTIEDAANMHFPVFEMRWRLRDQAGKCLAIAKRQKTHYEQARISAACELLNAAADWLAENEDAIDAARPPDFPKGDLEPGQKGSDDEYAKQYAAQSKADKATQDQNAKDILDEIAARGGKPTPILHARRKAVLDYKRRRYNPPIYDPGMAPKPPEPPEEPDLGDI